MNKFIKKLSSKDVKASLSEGVIEGLEESTKAIDLQLFNLYHHLTTLLVEELKAFQRNTGYCLRLYMSAEPATAHPEYMVAYSDPGLFIMEDVRRNELGAEFNWLLFDYPHGSDMGAAFYDFLCVNKLMGVVRSEHYLNRHEKDAFGKVKMKELIKKHPQLAKLKSLAALLMEATKKNRSYLSTKVAVNVGGGLHSRAGLPTEVIGTGFYPPGLSIAMSPESRAYWQARDAYIIG